MKKLLIITFVLFLSTLSFSQWKSYSAIISSGDSISAAIKVDDNYYIVGVDLPALTEGTTSISFNTKGQQQGAEYKPLWYDGSLYSVTIDSTGIYTELEFKAMVGAQHIEAVFPVAQSEDDTLWFQARKAEK